MTPVLVSLAIVCLAGLGTLLTLVVLETRVVRGKAAQRPRQRR